MPRPKAIYPHGTPKKYQNNKCRCKKCKAAWAQYMRKYRRLDPKKRDLTHGTSSSYNAGCRCDPCTKANTERYRRAAA